LRAHWQLSLGFKSCSPKAVYHQLFVNALQQPRPNVPMNGKCNVQYRLCQLFQIGHTLPS
jgi:hypothetical protein